ncbi:MAG TPA: type II secretion system protein [Verrucomicrobiae bacterium]
MRTKANGPALVSQRAFTFIDFLIVLVTICLAGVLVLPRVMRGNRAGYTRIGCDNNLKVIGLSFRMFSNDHNDNFPWNVPALDGGTKEFATSTNVYLHFLALSNELITPKILACSSDAHSRHKLCPILKYEFKLFRWA